MAEHDDARGRSVAAIFDFSRFASNTVSAWSKIVAGSPFATVWRSRSWTRRNFRYVSSDTVNCTLYRPGASGSVFGRTEGTGKDARAVATLLIGAVVSGATAVSASGGSAVCVFLDGNRRTMEATSGRGCRRCSNLFDLTL